MFVRSRSIASTASCLHRDHRSDRSSLIGERSRSTLACVTRERSESDVTGPHRSGVGWVLVLVGLFIDAL